MITISKNEILPTALNWKKEEGSYIYLNEEDVSHLSVAWVHTFWDGSGIYTVMDGFSEKGGWDAVAYDGDLPTVAAAIRRAEIAVMVFLKGILSQLSEPDKAKALVIINKVRAFYGKL